tara:strand:+ start:41081 stop:41242 length:162 start_codon:yes stop_codon:yes gene_type:complete
MPDPLTAEVFLPLILDRSLLSQDTFDLSYIFPSALVYLVQGREERPCEARLKK